MGDEVGVQWGENVEEKGDKGVLKKRKKVLEKRKKGIPLPNFRSKKPERNATQKNAKEFIEDIEKEKKRD